MSEEQALDELDLLIQEYDPEQSDWRFRKSVMMQLIERIRPATLRRSADSEDDLTTGGAWNDGCDFAMTQLCIFLGVNQSDVEWDAATETVDGDVQAVIGNILRAKFGEDWGPSAEPQTASGERLYTLKEAKTALEQAIQALSLPHAQSQADSSPQATPELTATCQKLLPGGIVDDATYAEIEDALDRAEAPSIVGGRWLKLHERIAALTAERTAASAEPQSQAEIAAIDLIAWLEADGMLSEHAKRLAPRFLSKFNVTRKSRAQAESVDGK